jgi:hypothetical protein
VSTEPFAGTYSGTAKFAMQFNRKSFLGKGEVVSSILIGSTSFLL